MSTCKLLNASVANEGLTTTATAACTAACTNEPENGNTDDLEQLAADLQMVIDSWPDLPEPIRADIAAMVRAAGGNAGQDR
jgi:hypothetical protein